SGGDMGSATERVAGAALGGDAAAATGGATAGAVWHSPVRQSTLSSDAYLNGRCAPPVFSSTSCVTRANMSSTGRCAPTLRANDWANGLFAPSPSSATASDCVE